jgi:hypothetical protein
MKKVLMIALLGLFSISSFADCKSKYQQNLNIMNSGEKDLIISSVGGTAAIISTAIFWPVGLGVFAVVGGTEVTRLTKKKKLKNMIKAIDDAYKYKEHGVKGDVIMKVFKKAKRRVSAPISVEDVADSIILSNETESMCDIKSVRKLSKHVAIQL